MKNLQSLDIKKIVTAITSIVETLFIYQYRDFLIIICSYSYQDTRPKKKEALLKIKHFIFNSYVFTFFNTFQKIISY